jgi:hypothetical protein
MKCIVEVHSPIFARWERSRNFPNVYTKKEALVNAKLGKKSNGMEYRVACLTPPPTTSRLSLAKAYQKQIADLEKEQEKLYKKALKALKLEDTTSAFDWFYNDQVGCSSFVTKYLQEKK